jgi:hypothetical protein
VRLVRNDISGTQRHLDRQSIASNWSHTLILCIAFCVANNVAAALAFARRRS